MHGTLTFREIIAVSAVIPVLLALSVICIALALERWMYFLRNGSISSRMIDRVRVFVKSGNFREAKQEVLRHRGMGAEAVAAQIDAINLPRNERESLMLYYHQRIQTMLGKRLWMFGTLSFICPLIGLLGTVLGVMTAFRDLALTGSGGPTIVAAGISEALIATAGGIAVAIMAAFIYNWFNIWLKSSLSMVDLFSQEIIFMTSAKSHHS